MKNRKESSTLQELTDAIKAFRLAQDKVNQLIEKAERETQDSEQQVNQEEDKLAIPRTSLKIGDRVQNTNAKHNQEDNGHITGYTVGEPFIWIWIRTPKGSKIKRIAKNLRRIN